MSSINFNTKNININRDLSVTNEKSVECTHETKMTDDSNLSVCKSTTTDF